MGWWEGGKAGRGAKRWDISLCCAHWFRFQQPRSDKRRHLKSTGSPISKMSRCSISNLPDLQFPGMSKLQVSKMQHFQSPGPPGSRSSNNPDCQSAGSTISRICNLPIFAISRISKFQDFRSLHTTGERFPHEPLEVQSTKGLGRGSDARALCTTGDLIIFDAAVREVARRQHR